MTIDGKDISIDRRKLLGTLAASSVLGLSGCAEDDDPIEGMGERVPPISMAYWSNVGVITRNQEVMSPQIRDSWEELGLTVDINPKEYSTTAADIVNDRREDEISFRYHTSAPDRVDPHEMTRRNSVDWAGANGRGNNANYASCEYTEPAVAQARATSPEEREELVHQAHSIFAEDFVAIPLFPTLGFTIINSEKVDVGGVSEERGFGTMNAGSIVESVPTGGEDTVSVNITELDAETRRFPANQSSAAVYVWSHLIHSTLTEYDANYDLQNMLAESIEPEQDGTRYIVELRDAQFHNGDPVTSEDVQYTFEHIFGNTEHYPHAVSPPVDSIDIIDDKTTEFNFEEPFPGIVSSTFPRWGIFHKETWVEGGADDDPEAWDFDPIIGSGPFTVEHFEQGSAIILQGSDNHPVHDPDHQVNLEVYRDTQSAFNSFEVEDLSVVSGTSLDMTLQAEEELDFAETSESHGINPYILYPQFPMAPIKFKEFRKALGASINRELLNDLAFNGLAEPTYDACIIQEAHPFRPPEDMLPKFTEDPTGDIEAAREELAEAGWDWDDDGNLHYPENADTEDLWPQGEVPSAEDFPCIDDLGLSPEG